MMMLKQCRSSGMGQKIRLAEVAMRENLHFRLQIASHFTSYIIQLDPKTFPNMDKPSKKKTKESANKAITKSSRAGIIFPVSRIQRYLRDMRDQGRVNVPAAVYTAAVLEYLTAELLQMSGYATKSHRKMHIQPRHILLAIRQDDEFNKLLNNITIAEGGVLPTVAAKGRSVEPSQAV